MEGKPNHYDGSIQWKDEEKHLEVEDFVLTDEMRKNISGNPFVLENQQ
ncbi:hypothetical protein [Sutcliffiella halmapala]|nr:hypothetical protein [Sutcliffiella halmapala]